MKEENLNNKKQEWVTPKISLLEMEDSRGKAGFPRETSVGFGNETGPS